MKYIAAPFGKIEDKESLMNYVTNYSATCFLEGFLVICPLTMGYNFGLKRPELFEKSTSWWMQWCRELMKKCVAIDVLMIDGWEDSLGVQEEIKFAKSLNIKINYIESDYGRV